jgi:hypothetical protein
MGADEFAIGRWVGKADIPHDSLEKSHERLHDGDFEQFAAFFRKMLQEENASYLLSMVGRSYIAAKTSNPTFLRLKSRLIWI